MKVTTERLPKSTIAIDIELDQQQVNKGLDRAARKLAQQFSIPGFRPGKAPRFIVENYLGKERVLEEASDDLINKSFKEALTQEQITPVGQPRLENVEQQPFRFRVTVPVEPVVELPDYRAYDIAFEREPVAEETVQRLLDAQREQHAVLRELEEPRPAQEGDMLTVVIDSDLDEDEEDEDDDELDDEELELSDEDEEEDEDDDDEDDEDDEFEASDEDEEEDEEGEDEEQQLALVPDRMRPEFFQALVGAQPGETRTVTVHHGEDEEDEQLRGRDVTYTIEVKNVQERLLPEWDELPMLTNFEGDLEALQANARRRLEHAADEKARQALLDAYVNRLTEETQLDLPDAMIEERAHDIFHQRVAQFTRYGLTEEQYLSAIGKTHEEAVGEFHDDAEADVKRSLVLRELIRRENLQVGDMDMAAELARFLQDYPAERQEAVRPLLESPEMMRMIASSALDRKLRDRLVSITTGEPEPSAAYANTSLFAPADEATDPGEEGAAAPDGVESGATEEPVVVGSSEEGTGESGA